MKILNILSLVTFFLFVTPIAGAHCVQDEPRYSVDQIAVSTRYMRERVSELSGDVRAYLGLYENMQHQVEKLEWLKNLPAQSDKDYISMETENTLVSLGQGIERYRQPSLRGLPGVPERMAYAVRGVGAIRYHARFDTSLLVVVQDLLSSVESLEWAILRFEEIVRIDTVLASYEEMGRDIRTWALFIATDLKTKLPALVSASHEAMDIVSGKVKP